MFIGRFEQSKIMDWPDRFSHGQARQIYIYKEFSKNIKNFRMINCFNIPDVFFNSQLVVQNILSKIIFSVFTLDKN